MVKVQLIIGSVRKGRIAPRISEWVATTLAHGNPDLVVEVLDLAEYKLPFDDEMTIPAHVESCKDYESTHTQLWSEKISQGDAYIFVFPQYNWGYPAVLKNAIDHLYREWRDKPAMVVTYGSRGGGRGGAQLGQVMQGLHMKQLSSGLEIKLSEVKFNELGELEDPQQLESYRSKLLELAEELERATSA